MAKHHLLCSGAIALLVACQPAEPSPERLKAALLRNPDVLYAVVRAHPDTFLAILGEAARQAQGKNQAASYSADSARIDADFLHPHVVSTVGRAGFGAQDAPVTIVEYTDFECPYCREERDVIVALLKDFPGKVRLVVKQMPVPAHPNAYPAALMFEAVARQSPAKAYRLYDALYTNQDALKSRGSAYLAEAVGAVGADVALALRDMQSDAVRAVVNADLLEGERLGFTGTPGFLVNGVLLQGAYPKAAFERVIQRHLAALPAVAK